MNRDKEKLLEALKGGIKGELDSINLYSAALTQAKEPEVRKFLQNRVEEEKQHYNFLIHHYQKIDRDQEIESIEQEIPRTSRQIAPMISDRFIEEISRNQFLFSSMSTAALLEKNAIDYYSKCAAETQHDDLKVFFRMMVKWESQHYDDIMDIQKETEHLFWEINRFEPF
ncbi:MAG: hypothetical protein JXB60_03015 [Candidatus Cloacimonetes bacterium]|nr:hypothetical protein [Candidatus Cloacimonadota bacterium]